MGCDRHDVINEIVMFMLQGEASQKRSTRSSTRDKHGIIPSSSRVLLQGEASQERHGINTGLSRVRPVFCYSLD